MTRRQPAAWWRRAYDVALLAFPREFRDRWGDDMRATFDDRARAASRNGVATPLLVLRELADVASSGIRERMRSTSRNVRIVHLQDVRYALRLLLRAPGFTLLTVLVLAGGLGLSTFTFSFLHTAMIRPLPLDEGERIVRVDPVVQGRRVPLDPVDIAPLRAALRSASELAAFGGRDIVVGTLGTTAGSIAPTDRRIVDATVADPRLFSIARTAALFGRTLLPSDSDPGAEPVIVLSYRTWEVAFGADRAVVDSYIAVDGRSTRVVGVMPEGFGFPVATESWLPLPAEVMRASAPSGASLRLVARLARDATPERAAAEAGAALRRLVAERDTTEGARTMSVAVESFPAAQFGEERVLVFTVLNLLAALILLLALVNVTNLLLARANERIRETAVRMALGASAGRLVMQGMWETVILCVVGGFVGTAGAAWGLEAITRWTRAHMEGNLAFWWVWRMDRVTILTAGAFVTVAIAVLGGIVAARALRTNVREVLQDGGARSGGRRGGRLSRVLVATQVATVTVLMFFGVISAVMARRVIDLDPGYPTAGLLQGGILPSEARHATPAARRALYASLAARMGESRELDRVVLRRVVAEQRSERGHFVRRDDAAAADRPGAYVVATLGTLATLGVRVVEGRALEASDDAGRAPVVTISRALAARHWAGRSPVGDQLRLTGVGDTTRWATIVGVVSDIPYGDPLSRDRSPEAIYVPLLQMDVEYTPFIVHARTSEVAARTALVEAFASVDPLLVPDGVQRLEEVLAKVGLIATSTSKLFAGCFAFALVLALVGTYALMSRAIAVRQREIAVRRALGANDRSLLRLLLGQGGRQLGVGTLAAAPLLLVTGLGFRHFFPLSGWITLVAGIGVSATIVALVLGATFVPARRALGAGMRGVLGGE